MFFCGGKRQRYSEPSAQGEIACGGNEVVGRFAVRPDDHGASRELPVLQHLVQFFESDLILPHIKRGQGGGRNAQYNRVALWSQSEGGCWEANAQPRLKRETRAEGEHQKRQKQHVHHREQVKELQSEVQIAMEFHDD